MGVDSLIRPELDPSSDNHRQLSTKGTTTSSPSSTDEGWVDSMVQVAHTANKLFSKHTCRLCQVYTDKQVEYETRQENALRYQQYFESSGDSSPIDRVWDNLEAAASQQLNIELYRQFLFDEESVVSNVSRHEQQEHHHHQGAEAAEEEDHSIVTQRTQ